VLDERPGVADRAGWSADPYLRATAVIDWTRPEILTLARDLGDGLDDPIEIARRCFEWVRDQMTHSVDAQDPGVTVTATEVPATARGGTLWPAGRTA